MPAGKTCIFFCFCPRLTSPPLHGLMPEKNVARTISDGSLSTQRLELRDEVASVLASDSPAGIVLY